MSERERESERVCVREGGGWGHHVSGGGGESDDPAWGLG